MKFPQVSALPGVEVFFQRNGSRSDFEHLLVGFMIQAPDIHVKYINQCLKEYDDMIYGPTVVA